MPAVRAFLVFAWIILFCCPVAARPAYLELWRERYPESTLPERLEEATGTSCTVCHPTSGYRWNEPGNAYREMLHAFFHAGKSRIADAIEAADGMDADGDGVTSGEEILAPRAEGGVGYHPGLVGALGVDPTGATGDEVVTGSLETPPVSRKVILDPPLLDYGNLPLGTVAFRDVTVRNTDEGPRTVLAMRFDLGPMTGYSIPAPPPLPRTLGPGESFSFGVRYMAATPGYFYRSLGWLELFVDRTAENPLTVLLRGRGAEGSVSISASSVEFGVMQAGGTSTLPITLSNTGDSPVTVSNPRLAGQDGELFQLEWDSFPSQTLGPDAATTLYVSFAPAGERKASASLGVVTDIPWQPEITLPLRGEGRNRVAAGDANGDGTLDISDALRILIGLFVAEDAACPDAHDAGNDGTRDISDAVSLLRHLFLAGPGPEGCALDASPLYLGCPEGSSCEG